MNNLKKREFVIQPTAISRSIYSASTFARRLMAMAMSLLPTEPKEESDYEVSFHVAEFLEALGMEKGGDTGYALHAAVQECCGKIIEIPSLNAFKCYTWFTSASLEMPPGEYLDMRQGKGWNWDKISFTFNPELAHTIGDFRKQYSMIDLLDFGKLQSRYAIRIYELALSFQGYAGKGENTEDNWFFIKTIEELRLLFKIEPHKYKVKSDFRKKVIDYPIEEINKAELGIFIETESVKQGRWLQHIKFHCKWIKKGDPIPVNPATETGKEDDDFIMEHMEEFEKLRAEALKTRQEQPDLPIIKARPEWVALAAEADALETLRKRYPLKKAKKRGKQG
jgi:hypothetical protein